MKYFEHESALTFDEAVSLMKDSRKGRKVAMAGGSDLMGVLKEQILEEYPETVIDLKTIEDSAYIKEEDGTIRVGALTTLSEIAKSPLLQEKAPVLAQAARSVATPLVRNVATIGGNICQDVRCWFYRYPHGVGGRMDCMRKGGRECYAIRGDNRYHSIFGGMHAGVTPCTAECPASTDIPGYMAKYRAGDMDGAARILMQANPFPMMTSRVCAHTCQTKCNRCSTDESVAIHSVERVVGDYILEHLDVYFQAPARETGKKIALVGAGPAGMTAAYYLRKAGHRVTVYEALEEAGGCLMYAIPNYRLPKSYVRTVIKALESMGVEFVCNAKLGETIRISDLTRDNDKVFIATGAWKRPVLGFDGEEFTEFGLQFLVDVNKWVNAKERSHVLVVGGGNVSMDVAITAKRLGAKSVTLCCLEQRDEMPASAEEVARAEEEGVVIHNGWGPLRADYGDNKLNGMVLKACVALRDETGRFNPTYDETNTMSVQADSILLATGQRVDLSFLENELELAVNRGLISVEPETQKSSDPKVYAGGDAVSGPTTVIMAIASGRRAADAINREMGVEKEPNLKQEGFIHFDPGTAELKKANNGHDLSVEERSLDKEDSTSLSQEEGLEEAKRCMNCGCYSVNASDISPVLILLDAEIVTTRKTVRAAEFFTTSLKAVDMLDQDELVKEIRFKIPEGLTTGYDKFRVREAVDFAIVSLAYAYRLKDGVIDEARLVLGGVAPVPMEKGDVASLLTGKKPEEQLGEEAARLAVKDAVAMEHNSYKIQEVKALVKRMVAGMR